MNNTYESYELKLDNIINNLNKKNKEIITENKEDLVENKKIEKNKQFETINYCYEMYKVRKNKKADFDIHSMNNLSIEDDDIDKVDKVLSWKDLDEDRKTKLIDDYVDYLYNIYSNKIKKEVIKNFILNNKSKIRYNKKDKKIDTIIGMICVNENELVIKKKITNSNELINKLRKSIKR
tara:strand:- start:288 stop:824 length:537 start_codon:yes stop_codon:yes gene_type:complete